MIDLATGRVRWSTQASPSARRRLAAADGLVLLADAGTLRGLDAKDGALRWSTGGLPVPTALELAGNVAVVLAGLEKVAACPLQ